MRKSVNAALIQSEETTEELVGILTAISIVSKRLAKSWRRLKSRLTKEGQNGWNSRNFAAANAD